MKEAVSTHSVTPPGFFRGFHNDRIEEKDIPIVMARKYKESLELTEIILPPVS